CKTASEEAVFRCGKPIFLVCSRIRKHTEKEIAMHIEGIGELEWDEEDPDPAGTNFMVRTEEALRSVWQEETFLVTVNGGQVLSLLPDPEEIEFSLSNLPETFRKALVKLSEEFLCATSYFWISPSEILISLDRYDRRKIRNRKKFLERAGKTMNIAIQEA